MKKVIYITSGKEGLHAFTYKELTLLNDNSLHFVLCLTQLNPGPFMPPQKWTVYILSKHSFFIGLINLLVSNPLKLSRILFESLNQRAFFSFVCSLAFYNKVKNEKATSVHCQMGDHKLFIGYYLSKLLNIPLTATIHAHELYLKDVYENTKNLVNVLNTCNRILTISEFNKTYLTNNLGISPSKIIVMPLYPANDVNLQYSNKKKILIIANWFLKKGYENLFKALSGLNRDDFILWAVGGPSKSEDSIDLYSLRDKYKLNERVIILGAQPREIVSLLLEKCDIFCLPSITAYDKKGRVNEREGIPVALMEAMQWGKPVISTIHAGIPELVEQLLVPENDTGELIKQINYLLDHPEKWAEMGKKNQNIIKLKFNTKNVQILINVLNSL